MRSRLPQSPLTSQTVGFCVSLCEVKSRRPLPISTTPFWTLAKKCMRATNKGLASKDIAFFMHFYENIIRSERGLHVINNSSVYYSPGLFFITWVDDGQLDFSLAHVIESEEKTLEFLDYYVRLVEACANAGTEITLDQLLTAVKSV